MERDLEITIKLAKEQAEREAVSFHEGEKARQRETASEAKRLARDAASEQTRLLKERADSERQAAREQTAARKAAVSEQLAYERDAARERETIRQEWADFERRLDKEQAQRVQESARMEALTLRATAAAIYTLGDAWKQVEERTIAAAKAAIDYEKQSRQVAALMGMAPEKATPELARFVSQTGMTAAEADQFIQQFIGTQEAGLEKKNITEAVNKELMLKAGQMGARLGGDQGTRGELAGILSQFGPIRTAREGLAQMEAIRQALTAGRGEDTPLTRELLATAGAMVREGGGGIRSVVEQAALIGVTSLAGGQGRAGERAEQLARFARGTTAQQIKKLRERFGVTEQMNLEERLNVIMPQLQAISQFRDVQTFLTEEGLANEETGRAAVELMGNFGVFQERMEKARRAMMAGGGAVEAENLAAQQRPLGVTQLGESREFAVQALRGRAERAALGLVQRARNEQLARKEDLNIWTQVGDKFRGVLSGAFFTPGETGARVRAETEAMEGLRRQALAVGVPPESVYRLVGPLGPLGPGTGGGVDQRPTISRMADLMELIRAKGGRPEEAVGQGASNALLGIPGGGGGGGNTVTDPDNAALMKDQNAILTRIYEFFLGGAGATGGGGTTGAIAPAPAGAEGLPARPTR